LGFKAVLREPNGARVTVQNGDCRIGLFQGVPRSGPGPADLLARRRIGIGRRRAARRPRILPGPSGQSDHATFMLRDPDGHPLFFIRMPGVVRQDAA
jgi:hypothetical protein